jgi:sterol 3beta-glucosyltransferase
MPLAPAPRPLRIALSTVGSTGDVQPFLALGKGLMARGHDVVALSHPFHAERFHAQGIAFRPCGPMIDVSEFNALLDKMVAERNPVKQLRVLMREGILHDGTEYFHAAKAALHDREFAVCHMIDFLGMEAAAQLQIPHASVMLTHAVVPTRVSTPPLVPNLGPLNPLAWWGMTLALSGVDRDVRAFLRTLGGPSITIHNYRAVAPHLNMLASSPTLACIPDAALPPQVQCTGPWILEEPSVALPGELLDFVARHPRPLIVSFGSMGGSRGAELSAMILPAIRQLEIPAIVQSGYAGLGAADLPDNVLQVGYLPHAQLFPLGGCILHHGGAGTTMAACRAGVPSAIVAFIADQPDFANHLRKLGLAPPYIWSRKLTVPRLAHMIADGMQPARYARAQAMRPQFLAEDGVQAAIHLIEGACR